MSLQYLINSYNITCVSDAFSSYSKDVLCSPNFANFTIDQYFSYSFCTSNNKGFNSFNFEGLTVKDCKLKFYFNFNENILKKNNNSKFKIKFYSF